MPIFNDEKMHSLRGKRIAMIFQDPMTALNPLLTIGQHLVETICCHLPLSQEEAFEEALKYLRNMDIPDPEIKIHHYPHQLSGGQRQRIVIALAMAGRPKVIIADEPTTALDILVQAQILTLLQKLAKDFDVGIVIIIHDMAVIKQITDKVAVMYKGQLLELQETKALFASPSHNYTKALLSSVPPIDKKLDRFVNVDYLEADAGHAKSSEIKWLFDMDEESTYEGLILGVKNLSMRFLQKNSLFKSRRTYFQALDQISFEVYKGQVLGIVGESGSGKSTVARVIAGLYKPSDGDIIFQGSGIKYQKQRVLARSIQMIFQDPFASLNHRMNIRSILKEPMKLHFDLSKKELEQRVKDLLSLVGLPATALEKYPHQFSGGQLQRICIARALSMKPRLLICDEPTSALDVSIQAQILNLLKDLQEELGLTMVFISHDLSVIRQICNEILVFKSGQLIERQQSEALFQNPKQDYTKQLLALMA